MKKVKKALALLVVAMMIVVMLPNALATTAGTQTFVITAPSSNTHLYQIYQIFTGDLSENVLTNVKWGINGTGTAGEDVADEVLTALKAVNADDKSASDKLAVIQNYVKLTGTPYTVGGKTDTEAGTTRVESVSVPAGYYLIKDVDNSLTNQPEAYTKYIVTVVKSITITPKADVPTMEKKVMDSNDSTGATSDWQDSADYDIGDMVPFKITGNLPSNIDAYSIYKVQFVDTMEAGLTFDKVTKITVGGTTVFDGTDWSNGATTDNVQIVETDSQNFSVTFSDVKALGATNSSTVVVEFQAELNNQAKLGSQGNVNTARMVFSNNPNSGHELETGKTPDDTVIVFTYQAIINKVTDNPNYDSSVEGSQKRIPLTGAEFKMEKLIKGSQGAEDSWTAVKCVKTNDSIFTFSGLDEGTYKLTETVTPSGYNKINPITFTVSADHTITWDGANRTGVLTSLNGDHETGLITFTPDVSSGSLSSDIVNQAGATLPSTGGVGTTMFYVIGSILVIGAVVLLVSKKRMNAAE